jgi:hypothetical protein
MQRLEVSGAVRPLYGSLSVKGSICDGNTLCMYLVLTEIKYILILQAHYMVCLFKAILVQVHELRKYGGVEINL